MSLTLTASEVPPIVHPLPSTCTYIACNHSLFMGGGSGDVLDARFRSDRTDGSDPLCAEFAASPACPGDASGVTMTNVTWQRWNASTDRWD